MKALLEDVLIRPNYSFSIEILELPHFISSWHYHSTIEIILFTDCNGTGFVGDKIFPFKPGTISLIGAGLPHVWLNNKEYYEVGSKLKAKAIVVKFAHDFAGKDFMLLPEMNKIYHLLQISRRGLIFNGYIRKSLEKKIITISKAEGISCVLILLDILRIMAETDGYNFLSSKVFSNSVGEKSDEKISAIFMFTMQNFEREISLEEVASIASITPNAFCRFFKKRVLKSYVQYLNEIRIGNACKLIIENKDTISNAGYGSGFNNLTHFHRQFKRITGVTPLVFKNKYWIENYKTNS